MEIDAYRIVRAVRVGEIDCACSRIAEPMGTRNSNAKEAPSRKPVEVASGKGICRELMAVFGIEAEICALDPRESQLDA